MCPHRRAGTPGGLRCSVVLHAEAEAEAVGDEPSAGRKQDQMTAAQIATLDALGFVWGTSRKAGQFWLRSPVFPGPLIGDGLMWLGGVADRGSASAVSMVRSAWPLRHAVTVREPARPR